jgi:predicted DsbA family dithiol-disulfide isomerase
VEIEIYSDIVCPWCYIGAARLRAALASFPGGSSPAEVVLRWRPFQLDPGAVREPVAQRLARKFGGEAAARAAIARASAAGAAEGLAFDYDKAIRADTFDAHRLLWFADLPAAVAFGAGADCQPRLADLLHRAHFRDGLDVAAHDVLTSLAADVGLDGRRVRDMLDSTEGADEVRRQLAEANDMGITAVPTFLFDGRYAVVGAHEASTLRRVLDEVIGADDRASASERGGGDQADQRDSAGDRTAEAVDDDRAR